MNFNPTSEIRYLWLFLFFSIIIGWLLGSIAWVLVFTLSCYIGWNLHQLFRLYKWLKNPNPTDPPSSSWLWGAVFDDIYALQQRQFKYRVRLKKVIKRFRDSTYALADGFVMLDHGGILDWWNPAAEILLGFRASTDSGQLITNLIRCPQFKTYFYKGSYNKPLEINSPINSLIILECQVTRFGKKDILIIIRDITEIKHLEQVRTDFIGNISHELRTPLTVISGYLETMEANSDNIPPLWIKAIKNTQIQTERLKNLVGDLLILSKIESQLCNAQQAPINIPELLQEIKNDLESLIQNKQHIVNITIDSKYLLIGNRDDIYSLVTNLLVNACYYSPKGSHIQASWASDKTGGYLSIADNGQGIDPMEVPRITERFYRVESHRSRDSGGTGLGLAIVKHLLINHDGNLKIESKLNVGSTFICEFPLQRLKRPNNLLNNEEGAHQQGSMGRQIAP